MKTKKEEKKPWIAWRCKHCKSLQVSIPYQRHHMDSCKCGKTMVDLEVEYCRIAGEQPIMWEEIYYSE